MTSQMNFLTRVRKSTIVTVFITSFWLSVVFTYYVPMLVVLPLALVPKVGVKFYRLLIGFYDVYWGRWACLSVPFSHCNTQMFINKDGYAMLDEHKGSGNSLILSTHGSRIDWLFGVFIGMVPRNQARIGFVAEVTAALMPIIGWSRYLLGDILLQRAFHKDGPRILENIREHHESGVMRLIFLAPEGTIADPGIDEAYVEECSEFMRKNDKEPLTHCLTPRYKGMNVFLNHAPEKVLSCVMSFVAGPETCKVDPKTGVAVGGRLCNLSLLNPARTIPDLHSLFEGDFNIFVHIHKCHFDRDPVKIKGQLIDDQIAKDALLRSFEKNRKFDGVKSIDDYEKMPKMHLKLNTILVIHLLMTHQVVAWLFSVSYAAALMKMIRFVLFAFLIHFSTHSIGMLATDNVSRESLIGETAIKALLNLCLGRSMNRGGKPAVEQSKKVK